MPDGDRGAEQSVVTSAHTTPPPAEPSGAGVLSVGEPGTQPSDGQWLTLFSDLGFR